MTALVIAEHDNASIKGATLNTVTAAAALGGEVDAGGAGLDREVWQAFAVLTDARSGEVRGATDFKQLFEAHR